MTSTKPLGRWWLQQATAYMRTGECPPLLTPRQECTLRIAVAVGIQLARDVISATETGDRREVMLERLRLDTAFSEARPHAVERQVDLEPFWTEAHNLLCPEAEDCVDLLRGSCDYLTGAKDVVDGAMFWLACLPQPL